MLPSNSENLAFQGHSQNIHLRMLIKMYEYFRNKCSQKKVRDVSRSKLLKGQKCIQKRKQWNKKMSKQKKKCFYSFIWVIDHTNVHFFFLISLWAWSYSLNDIKNLHCFGLFDNMKFLKIIHKEGCFMM